MPQVGDEDLGSPCPVTVNLTKEIMSVRYERRVQVDMSYMRDFFRGVHLL